MRVSITTSPPRWVPFIGEGNGGVALSPCSAWISERGLEVGMRVGSLRLLRAYHTPATASWPFTHVSFDPPSGPRGGDWHPSSWEGIEEELSHII